MVTSTTFQPRAAPASAPPRPAAAAPGWPPGSGGQPARTASPTMPANASRLPRGICGGRSDWGLRRKTGLEARIVAEWFQVVSCLDCPCRPSSLWARGPNREGGGVGLRTLAQREEGRQGQSSDLGHYLVPVGLGGVASACYKRSPCRSRNLRRVLLACPDALAAPLPSRRSGAMEPFAGLCFSSSSKPDAAWEELIGRFGAGLKARVGSVLRRCGVRPRDEHVEEIVQEVYCRLLAGGSRRLRRCRATSESQVGAYLGRVAERVALDQLRAARAQKRGGPSAAVAAAEAEGRQGGWGGGRGERGERAVDPR